MTAYGRGSGSDWDLGWLLKTFAESGFGGPRGSRGSWQERGQGGRGWGPPGAAPVGRPATGVSGPGVTSVPRCSHCWPSNRCTVTR